ncbi:MAG: hypothetical protein ACI9BW_001803 [Gammaproteobacteria bacterium]|jgi:hypothetical protein
MTVESSDVWENQARQWERVGSPLRPSAEDHKFMTAVINDVDSRIGKPHALLLGVTPEMATLPWPQGSELLAVDCSQSMIDTVWPGFPRPGEGVLRANWLNLPLQQRSRNLVLSDGPFGVLCGPSEYEGLLHNIRRILMPGGLFTFRVFLQAEVKEEPDAVYRAVMDGEINGFHTFKLRLLMAHQPDDQSGVRVGDVWSSWATDGPGADALAECCGWPLAQIETINAYRDQDSIYTFPTLQQLRAQMLVEGFSEVSCSRPTYELGERCPTLVFDHLAEFE